MKKNHLFLLFFNLSALTEPYPFHDPLSFEKIVNFRDVATASPRALLPGRIYRTGCISNATPSDVERLKSLNIKTLIDLRSTKELANDERLNCEVYDGFESHSWRNIKSVGEKKRKRYFVKMMGRGKYVRGVLKKSEEKWKMIGSLGKAAFSSRERISLRRSVISRVNEGGLLQLNEFLLTESGRNLSRVLKLLTDRENHPIAMYCTAGKDRTGVIVAICLLIAGIEKESIINDYTKSKNAYSELNSKKAMIAALSQYELDSSKFLGAPPEVMTGTLDLLESYGGPEKYLDSIGFDLGWRRKLKSALTEP